ncbi:DinB family protein [Phaeodactylibacter xiamenensis]|uniref:DinB family protein n=1 Tax=Phaeodactylibacter xiamenensis TaxID=1524460 RepID=UPI0024A88BEF|nr:DinB family protein [Phaeodactylibacter xiamenensis]
MDNSKSLRQFEAILTIWEQALPGYSEVEFAQKPSPESWSVGQVYQHLIQASLDFHLKEVEHCLANDNHAEQRKNLRGTIAYHMLGQFPPIRIKVPASESYTPKQPKNKAAVTKGLNQMRHAMKQLATQIDGQPSGKTQHPGFDYLNASEWYRLVPMHFKHHLRQKARLDKYLKTLNL